MTNAQHVSPGRAITRALALYKGMLRLAAETGDDKHILSLYAEGEPGVGKSAIFKAIARRLNYLFVDIRANMMNPDDAGGTRMQDMETKTTEWFPPYWMPREDGVVVGRDGKKYDGTLLFFDELASADDRVRKPLFGVFLDRSLNDRRLPRNCLVAAAGNEAESGTMVFELDNATRTRFITMKIVADFEGWERDFAPSADISPTTISYLKQNMHRFCETERALNENRGLYGNPRSWEHVSSAERAIMETQEDRRSDEMIDALEMAVAGKVGTELAAEYIGVFRNVAEMANLYDIMQATTEERKKLWPKSIGQLYALAYSMMSFPTDIAQAKRITGLMNEMPKKGEAGSDLPFEEMKAPIREIILKRLKEAGIREADINKAFHEEAKEEMAALLANGPLIKLS